MLGTSLAVESGPYHHEFRALLPKATGTASAAGYQNDDIEFKVVNAFYLSFYRTANQFTADDTVQIAQGFLHVVNKLWNRALCGDPLNTASIMPRVIQGHICTILEVFEAFHLSFRTAAKGLTSEDTSEDTRYVIQDVSNAFWGYWEGSLYASSNATRSRVNLQAPPVGKPVDLPSRVWKAMKGRSYLDVLQIMWCICCHRDTATPEEYSLPEYQLDTTLDILLHRLQNWESPHDTQPQPQVGTVVVKFLLVTLYEVYTQACKSITKRQPPGKSRAERLFPATVRAAVPKHRISYLLRAGERLFAMKRRFGFAALVCFDFTHAE